MKTIRFYLMDPEHKYFGDHLCDDCARHSGYQPELWRRSYAESCQVCKAPNERKRV